MAVETSSYKELMRFWIDSRTSVLESVMAFLSVLTVPSQLSSVDGVKGVIAKM